MSDDSVEQHSEVANKVAPAHQQPPDLSRLLSVTAILVALAVAGSFVLDDMTRFERAAHSPASPKTPSAQLSPAGQPDGRRVKVLEKRIALLERQIVLLQEQSLAEQRQTSSMQVKLTAIEDQMIARDTESISVALREPDEAEKPQPMRTAAVQAEPPAAAPAKKLQRPDRGKPDPLPEPVIDVSAEDPDPVETTTVPAPKQLPELKPILTGSLPEDASEDATHTTATPTKQEPAPQQARPAKISRTRFALALDLHNNITEVIEAWDELQLKHSDLFSDIEPRALRQGTQDGKLKYRLMVGPIVNAASAAKRCAKLSRYGITCRASVFGGEPLESPPSPGTLIQVEVVDDNLASDPALPRHIRQILAKAPLPKPKPRLTRATSIQ